MKKGCEGCYTNRIVYEPGNCVVSSADECPCATCIIKMKCKSKYECAAFAILAFENYWSRKEPMVHYFKLSPEVMGELKKRGLDKYITSIEPID